MLVHAFTDRIGARALLAAGTGASAAGPGAPAGDLGILVCTQLSFTLGALTLEQAKHLTAADAGALAGLTSLPSLRTWRERLGELAGTCDPLALQRRLASQMLAIEPAESQVYLADDHIAEYTGHQAVALGRNPRRGKPAKGHDDTYICDLAGRAISFTTGEPSALCTTLPPALAALTDALPARDKPGPARRPLIVFDRGAAFPGTFTAVDAAGYDWLTWRRAPLAATTLLPILQTITLRGGRQRQVAWTGEQVTLNDYGKPVRQLSLFEHGKMVAQAISGRLDACPAELAGWLRGRRAEENMFKYDMINYGLDTLADYDADEVVNTKLKANPAFTTAKKAETKAKTALANAEVALAKLLADPAIVARTKNDELIPPRPAEDHSLRAGADASRGRAQEAPREAARQPDRPGRDPRDPAHQPALPATGPAPSGRQRRALPRPAPQRLPQRRRRVPGHHPGKHHPRPRRHHHLQAQEHHRNARPAQPGARHARPHPAHRRDQHPPAGATRRRPAHHLHPPAVTVIALSRPPTAGGLCLRPAMPSQSRFAPVGHITCTGMSLSRA
jgi:hypothetical protein